MILASLVAAALLAVTALIARATLLIARNLPPVVITPVVRCRQCRHDPRGHGPDVPDRCGVCRADLTRPGAVLVRDHMRRPGRVAGGVGLLVLGGLFGWACLAGLQSVSVYRPPQPTPWAGQPWAARQQHPPLPPVRLMLRADYPKATLSDLIALVRRRGDDPLLWAELRARCLAGEFRRNGQTRTFGDNPVTQVLGELTGFNEDRDPRSSDIRSGHALATTRPATMPTAGPLAFVAAASHQMVLDGRSLILLARAFDDPPQAVWPLTVRSDEWVTVRVWYTTVPVTPDEAVFAVKTVGIDPGMFAGHFAPGPASVDFEAVVPPGRTPTPDDASASATGGGRVDLRVRVNARPGPHLLTLSINAAVLTRGSAFNAARPGQTAAWPPTPATWFTAVPMWVEVLPPATQP